MSCLLNTPHIAVIGAGLAGVSCASQLEQLGMRVTVFDKSRGTGGRMSTRRGDQWQADHGAQYFTARDPLFSKELLRWQQAGVASAWQPALAVLDAQNPNAARRHDNDSGTVRFVGVPRMSSPVRWLADELQLTLSARVNALIRRENRWRLCFDDSVEDRARLENIDFDAVALAIPPEQAVALIRPHAAAFAAQCDTRAMRPCWAAMLRFDARVALPFDAAFINDGPLRWIARDTHKPGRPSQETWVLHATAAWSEQHLESSADEASQALTDAFKALGGTTPTTATAHRWRYAEPTTPAQSQGCLWDAALNLGLCGDWLSAGRVEGAWLSGRALARSITSLE